MILTFTSHPSHFQGDGDDRSAVGGWGWTHPDRVDPDLHPHAVHQHIRQGGSVSTPILCSTLGVCSNWQAANVNAKLSFYVCCKIVSVKATFAEILFVGDVGFSIAISQCERCLRFIHIEHEREKSKQKRQISGKFFIFASAFAPCELRNLELWKRHRKLPIFEWTVYPSDILVNESG